MAGGAPSPALVGGPRAHGASADEELFAASLVASSPRPGRAWRGAPVSLALHAATLALLVLVPIYAPVEMPPGRTDYILALVYDPPPPPPPPLPKGTPLARRPETARPVTPSLDVRREAPRLQAPIEIPTPRMIPPLVPEAGVPELEQWGSETGSEFGVREGMEGGVLGGQVGGVPGGVLGGVIGGTGTGPVPVRDYDRPPQPIRITRPVYPHDAFVKKVEGTVYLEILIDSEGRVVDARILRSVPMLDRAAVECVLQWRFAPALKRGLPVPTVAQAPVSFRIY